MKTATRLTALVSLTTAWVTCITIGSGSGQRHGRRRGKLFDEDLDRDDPWQFKNFRVT